MSREGNVSNVVDPRKPARRMFLEVPNCPARGFSFLMKSVSRQVPDVLRDFCARQTFVPSVDPFARVVDSGRGWHELPQASLSTKDRK